VAVKTIPGNLSTNAANMNPALDYALTATPEKADALNAALLSFGIINLNSFSIGK